MKVIPLDTRTRILARYDSGALTRAEVAEQHLVSVDFVKKLLRQRKKLGRVEPLYDRVGRKPAVKEEHTPKLREALREAPGTTLAELRALLGSTCSTTSVFRALRRMGFTHKKRPCARPSKPAKTSARPARRGAC